MLDSKFARPGKPGHIWPGVYKISPASGSTSNPWHLACPAPMCFFRGAYADEGMARKMQETHTCPWFAGGTTTLSWGVMSDHFLKPIWQRLDDVVDALMAEKSKTPEERGHEYELERELAGKARGLAEALCILMPPFFSTSDEIAHEAIVRREHRLAGNDYETPGVGRLKFKVPPKAEVMTPSGLYHEQVVGTKYEPEYHPAAIRSTHGFSPEKIEAIVTAASKGFPVRMLATVHSTTERIINDIVKAHGSKS